MCSCETSLTNKHGLKPAPLVHDEQLCMIVFTYYNFAINLLMLAMLGSFAWLQVAPKRQAAFFHSLRVNASPGLDAVCTHSIQGHMSAATYMRHVAPMISEGKDFFEYPLMSADTAPALSTNANNKQFCNTAAQVSSATKWAYNSAAKMKCSV